MPIALIKVGEVFKIKGGYTTIYILGFVLLSTLDFLCPFQEPWSYMARPSVKANSHKHEIGSLSRAVEQGHNVQSTINPENRLSYTSPFIRN